MRRSAPLAGTIREVSLIGNCQGDHGRAEGVAGKKERQRKLARERYRRQQARRDERQRKTRLWTVTAIGAVLFLGLAGTGAFFATESSGPPAAAPPSATPSASATPTEVAEPAHHCTYTANPPAARKVSFPPATPDYKASYRATIKTNRGNIVIHLLNSKATCTVNSFIHLAEQDFFNSTPCWRLSNSGGLYLLQCGSTTRKGTGGPGYEFESENLSGATYGKGTVAMANSGTADSNGSQFFLVYRNSTESPDYTPFGKIISGLNILQKVGKRGYGPPLSSAGGGKPKESVTIKSVVIKKT
jgi:cyclophilin family peptidyl-prolyl cis-trans isomerase